MFGSPGSLLTRRRAGICGPTASTEVQKTSSTCRIKSRRVSLARSRPGWSKRRSSAPSANRPKASMPTITICVELRISIKILAKVSIGPCHCSPEPLSWTRLSQPLTPPAQFAISDDKRPVGWPTAEKEVSEAARLARAAIAFGKDDAVVLARAGHVLTDVVHEFEAGQLFIERALALNPNCAIAWQAMRLADGLYGRSGHGDSTLCTIQAAQSA